MPALSETPMVNAAQNNLPHGYRAAEAAWVHDTGPTGKPYTLQMWHQLTFGDQAMYGAQECKTNGAVYTIHVSSNDVSVSVKLPVPLTIENISEQEAKWIEYALHRKMEETIHWIITRRRQVGIT